ncbi:hypothetical protein [Paraburkholderia susongensis]|uniref:hypothetical protein n=1 Tax=Paraburkholderia susongensis TaxID=1515439 RepID=UPI0011812049|nr:hypothetical protein [Paraburkholderia susongensis]
MPTNNAPTGRLNTAVQPPVFDSVLIDFYQNLIFLPGDDVSHARAVYQQTLEKQLASRDTQEHEVHGEKLNVVTPTNLGNALDASSPAPPNDISLVSTNSSDTKNLGSTDAELGDGTKQEREQPAPGISIRITSDSPSLAALSSSPSFDELVEKRWIHIAWDRVLISGEVWTVIWRSQEPKVAAFKAMLEALGVEAFALASDYLPGDSLLEYANEVVAGTRRPSEIACISPAWIAARIWDTSSRAPQAPRADSERRIGHWVDCWRCLGAPTFALSRQLESTEFEAFIDATLDVLARPSVSPSWDDLRAFAVAPLRLLYPHRAEQADAILPAPPVSTIERLRWTERHAAQSAFRDFAFARGSSLMAMLTNELRESAFDPKALAIRLLDLVVERPILFVQLVMVATSTPVMLADMLMSPSTCALACLLIAGWQYNGGGWNRAFQSHANQATELFAFEDALAVLGSHIEAARIPACDLAALFVEIYKLSLDPAQSFHRREMLSLLRGELSAAAPELKVQVFRTLLTKVRVEASPIEFFFAVLDMASEDDVVELAEPSELPMLYLEVVLPKASRLQFGQLDSRSSCFLCQLALRCDAQLRQRFLNAIDVTAWSRETPADASEQFAFRHQLILRIRLHIYVLSRAIAAWPSVVPSDLVDALSRAVQAGAIDHSERYRIDVFNVSLTSGVLRPDEPSISLDLAAALRRLEGNLLQTLVTQLCQVEEPAVLAEIAANTPASHNEQIARHLQTLTPSSSSKVGSLPALQARVNALLAAGLTELAEAFSAVERDAITLGRVQGREIARLRVELGMLTMRSDWTGLSAYVLPTDLSPAERNEAVDALAFYCALAELKKEGGDFAGAEATFARLSQRHPNVVAYTINLFVSRVHRLLNNDTFRLLSGSGLVEAKQYLSEAERDVLPLIQHSVRDLKPFNVNRIMLMLATGLTREALEVSLQMREAGYDAYFEGFGALAMARLGSKSQALTALTDVERVFGRIEFLAAVRGNIDEHRPYSTVPSLAVDDDPVPGLRHAFEAFSRLGHEEQAQVLQERGRIDLYLLEQVRGACASLVAVAPMMEGLGMLRLEDNISGVLKQLLLSRLLIAQWAVQDQPRGGVAESGGVGERDIVISKGTVELAVLEALTVESVETTNLTSHFRKLFKYGNCRFFFHITYSRGANRTGIIRHLKTMCASPPDGIDYQRTEDLPDNDTSPIGFKAFYTIESREIIMTFLVLDMGRPFPRNAAPQP